MNWENFVEWCIKHKKYSIFSDKRWSVIVGSFCFYRNGVVDYMYESNDIEIATDRTYEQMIEIIKNIFD